VPSSTATSSSKLFIGLLDIMRGSYKRCKRCRNRGQTYTFPQGGFVDTTAMATANDAVKKYMASGDQNDPSRHHVSLVWLIVSKSPERVSCDDCSSVRTSAPSIIQTGSTGHSTDHPGSGTDIQNTIKELLAKVVSE
jgi:hypothetical protein